MKFFGKKKVGRENLANNMWQVAKASYRGKESWQVGDFAASIEDEQHFILFAFEEEKLVAFIQWQLVIDEGEVLNLVVLPEYQRRGVAYKLLKKSLQRLKVKGISRFFLEVRVGNRAANPLYQKIGFQEIARRKNYYQHPVEDARILALENR